MDTFDLNTCPLHLLFFFLSRSEICFNPHFFRSCARISDNSLRISDFFCSEILSFLNSFSFWTISFAVDMNRFKLFQTPPFRLRLFEISLNNFNLFNVFIGLFLFVADYINNFYLYVNSEILCIFKVFLFLYYKLLLSYLVFYFVIYHYYEK